MLNAPRRMAEGQRSVKHLNPRQGITTVGRFGIVSRLERRPRVKHLNPRQGITTTAALSRGMLLV